MQSRWKPWHIVAVYVVLGSFWIFVTDAIVGFFFDPARLPALQTGKGIAYIVLTALVLLLLLRHARRHLLRSEQRYKALFDGATDAIFLMKGSQFIACNPATLHIFGCSTEREVVLRSPWELSPPVQPDGQDSQDKAQHLLRAAAEGTPQHFEWRHLRVDGTAFDAEVSLNRVALNADTYLQAIVRDITQRKLAEKALRENEQFLTAVLDGIQAGICVLDPDLTIRQVNATMRSWYSENTPLEGKKCYVGYHNYDGPCKDCPSLRCLESGRVEYDVVPGLPGSGVTWVELYSYPLRDRETGAITGVIEFVNDISAQREAEEENARLAEQLRHSQKLEAVGQLAGGVAHDFNNLLQVINGHAEIGLDRAPGDPKVRDDLRGIAEAGLRAARLVRQLLAFSRRQVIKPEHCDLNQVVEELLKMLERLIGENIELEFVAAHQLGAVYADRGMLEQVVVNLCVNARDAMTEGGTLTLETENVVMNADYCRTHPWAQPGRYALLSVTDTGVGMDQETVEHIFEPFFSTKHTGHGTGLGLATAYGIVQQHEGMIQAYSEPGRGTTFKVYLPMHEREALSVGSKIDGAVRGGSETILLAEDDEMVRRLATNILERAGYRVVAAANGEEALRIFEQNPDGFDLLLLDVVMPRLGGRGVHERARRLRPQVRTVFASGYSENAVHTNFVLNEGMRLIQKPFARDTLLRAVRVALDGTANG